MPRVTIVLNLTLQKRLREIQSKKIKKSIGSVSFSQVVNEVLEKGLDKF